MQQFFISDISAKEISYTFSEQESKHITRVLRKVSGDQIRFTNGKGDLFWGTLDVISPKKCLVTVTRTEYIEPSKVTVHMAVAPTKNMDRFEWFLEKATELGVHRITPILCARSERKQLSVERCEKIITAAVKQSLRAYAPILDPLTPLQKLSTEASTLCIAHCEPSEKAPLNKVITNQRDSCILIGPEGDFTPDEILWSLKNKITAVDLGNVRLRTETAALVALHTAILLNAK